MHKLYTVGGGILLSLVLKTTCYSGSYFEGDLATHNYVPLLATNTYTPPPVDYTETAPLPPPQSMSQLGPAFAPMPTTEKPLLQWGPVVFHPQLGYRIYYATGLNASPGRSYDSLINEVSPGITFNIGHHWFLSYVPTLRFYSDSHFRDTTDQAVLLSWGNTYKDWALGFSQSYAFTSQPLIETGSQTEQSSYFTGLNANYSINSKLSLQLSVAQNFQFGHEIVEGAPPLNDSKTWSTTDWLNYQISSRLGVAVGVGGGYSDVTIGSDMPFEQLNGRVTFKLAEKLSFLVSGGVEFRQFTDSDVEMLVSPLFSGVLQYQPVESTIFSVTANRSVAPSFYGNEVVETSSLSLGLRQRLLGKLYLDLGGGFYDSSYIEQVPGLATARTDKGTFFASRLSALIGKRGNAGVFYRYNHNSSDSEGFDYSSSQAGLDLAVRF